jgi:hypothetical protein
MSDTFEDQAIVGVMESGVEVELGRWACEHNEYDADGWLDAFGDRVGSGTAKLPGNVWVDLSRFCVLRPVTRMP